MLGLLITIVALLFLPILLWNFFKFAVKLSITIIITVFTVVLDAIGTIFNAIRIF